jgi:hypothetical protein
MLTAGPLAADIAAVTARATPDPDPEVVKLATRLRTAMVAKDYIPERRGDVARLARVAAVDKSVIARLLRYERKPLNPTLQRLALALEVRDAWLILDEPPMGLVRGVEPGSNPEHLSELASRRVRDRRG